MGRPELSFIIPTLNEEVHIGGVLDAIRTQVGQRLRYEVVVVDNGSCDQTMPIARSKGALCLAAPGCTISALRNLGAARAEADILVFLDADVYLGKGWGERIVEVLARLQNAPEIVTGSLYGISEENNWIERIWFAPRTTRTEVGYINGGHLILHRQLFLQSGGFDTAWETGEDCEFCARLRRQGARILNDPELQVVHAGYPKTLRGFFARERWHGRGDCRSFARLASSKPALVSLANLCMVVACLVGPITRLLPWFIFPSAYVVFLAGVSLAASVHRLRAPGTSGFVATIFLYMVYFTARSVSLADIALQSLRQKYVASIN